MSGYYDDRAGYGQDYEPVRGGRIDARPRNRWDVQAGMRSAHLDTKGNVVGGYAPDGRALGVKATQGGAAPDRDFRGLRRWEEMNPGAPKAFAAGSPANTKSENRRLAVKAGLSARPENGAEGPVMPKPKPREATLADVSRDLDATPDVPRKPSPNQNVSVAFKAGGPTTFGPMTPIASMDSFAKKADAAPTPAPASPLARKWDDVAKARPSVVPSKPKASPFGASSGGPVAGPVLPSGGMGPAHGPWRPAPVPKSYATPQKSFLPTAAEQTKAKQSMADYEAGRRSRIDAAKAAAKEDDWLVGTMAGDAQRAFRKFKAGYTK